MVFESKKGWCLGLVLMMAWAPGACAEDAVKKQQVGTPGSRLVRRAVGAIAGTTALIIALKTLLPLITTNVADSNNVELTAQISKLDPALVGILSVSVIISEYAKELAKWLFKETVSAAEDAAEVFANCNNSCEDKKIEDDNNSLG